MGVRESEKQAKKNRTNWSWQRNPTEKVQSLPKWDCKGRTHGEVSSDCRIQEIVAFVQLSRLCPGVGQGLLLVSRTSRWQRRQDTDWRLKTTTTKKVGTSTITQSDSNDLLRIMVSIPCTFQISYKFFFCPILTWNRMGKGILGNTIPNFSQEMG